VLRADCPVDAFKQSVRRVQVRAADDAAQWESMPGLLHVEQIGNASELTFVDVDGTKLERIRSSAEGPVEVMALNLEDAFIAYTSERRRRTLELKEQ
jgi:hypothetical protein